MTMPDMSRSGGPNFLGAEHAPFVVGGNPSSPDFNVRDVVLPQDVSECRAEGRQELRQSLDRLTRITDAAAEDPAVGFDSFYRQGVDLVTSPKAQAAFDLSKEPDATRDLYGRNDFGQRLLLARRLVEVGVSFVTCYYGGWDHHTKIFKSYKEAIGAAARPGPVGADHRPATSAACSTIDAGLLPRRVRPHPEDQQGRRPRPLAARDVDPRRRRRHPRRPGRRRTDAKGYYASGQRPLAGGLRLRRCTRRWASTRRSILHNTAGRPVQLVNGGTPIKELFA